MIIDSRKLKEGEALMLDVLKSRKCTYAMKLIVLHRSTNGAAQRKFEEPAADFIADKNKDPHELFSTITQLLWATEGHPVQ